MTMNQRQTAQQEPNNGRPSRPLWRNRDFLLLWNGQTISTLGTNISTLALPLLVLALTHSPAQAGLLTATRLLPYLLFSLPAGALLDRWDRKEVMIRCDLIRWLALGSVPLAFALGHLTLVHLYVVAFLEGDPDRPIITGCVYNGSNMPPFALPDNQTRSGVRGRSTPGGGYDGGNEIHFEDAVGRADAT